MKTLIEHIVDSPSGWDGSDIECWQLSPATFIKDFGPWKKGQQVSCFCLNLAECKALEYDNDGKVVQECDVTLVPADVLGW